MFCKGLLSLWRSRFAAWACCWILTSSWNGKNCFQLGGSFNGWANSHYCPADLSGPGVLAYNAEGVSQLDLLQGHFHSSVYFVLESISVASCLCFSRPLNDLCSLNMWSQWNQIQCQRCVIRGKVQLSNHTEKRQKEGWSGRGAQGNNKADISLNVCWETKHWKHTMMRRQRSSEGF